MENAENYGLICRKTFGFIAGNLKMAPQGCSHDTVLVIAREAMEGTNRTAMTEALRIHDPENET